MKTCKAEGCDRTDIKAWGYCNMHYARLRANGTLEPKQRMDHYRDKHPELYKTWTHMRHRCNTNDPQVRPHYKDKGVKVCERWSGLDGFRHFVEDMGDKPSYARTKGGMPLYTLDRIDSNKDYCPENCRWANWQKQATNRNICNKVPGVSWDKCHKCWTAYLTIRGNQYKKYRVSYDEAVKIRKDWEQKYPQEPGGIYPIVV